MNLCHALRSWLLAATTPPTEPRAVSMRKYPLAGHAKVWIVVVLFWAGRGTAVPAANDADQFYDPASVQIIHLDVSPEDLARQHRALPKRIYVPATFRWNKHVVERAGLRYKGNSSSSPDSPHKRSFLVNFSEFSKGRRLLGLRHVALDNGIQFGSLFSERLITDALRGLGLMASRCNYAKVYLNRTYLGVYVNVERIDQAFLQHRFGASQGSLFKIDEGGPGADLRYLGDNLATYREAFELHSGNEVEAFSRLLEFIRGIDSPAAHRADLTKSFDVESFLKTTAVMLFAGAFDQYTGWQPHNYYLYQNPGDRRWTYIPWDLDVGFADNAFGRVPVLEGWDAAWPAPVPGRPLMERIVSDPVLLRRYREQASAILEAWFRPDVLIPKLHGLYAQIRSALEEDPHRPQRVTVPSDSGYADILSSMEAFIRQRYTLARSQLDDPGPRPQPKAMSPAPVQEGPTPGSPSADAPAELHAVKVTSAMVELRWTDHAEGEVAVVVQRAAGAAGGDFANAIGQPGPNLTSAIDHNVQPGMTYRYRVYAVMPTPHGPRGTGVSNVISVRIPEN